MGAADRQGDRSGAEDGRTSWADVVLPGRMLAKLRELNPQVPGEYLEQALTELVEPRSQDAIAENHRLHKACADGHRGDHVRRQ
jgi:type I restriction enzyme R subunit